MYSERARLWSGPLRSVQSNGVRLLENINKSGVRMNVLTRMGCVLFAYTVSGLAVAQQPTPQHIAERKVNLNLASQPLQDALHAFSQATGLKVMFLTDLGKGIISPHVSGTLTPEAALQLLLKGADLRFKYLDSQTIAVLPAHEASSDSALRPMSRIDTESIRTASVASATDGSVIDSGAGGSDSDQTQQSVNAASAGTKAGRQEGVEEVIVTAQKREERLKDVPISISVLSGSDLDKSTAQGVDEMLNRVPGVVAATTGIYGGTQVAIRGVAAGGAVLDGSSPNAYYLDSVPFGFVRHAYAPDANAYDLQRVEVLRGPQGTLYGASAEAGVVRVLTNDANLNDFDLKARTTLSSTDGGGGNYRGDMAVNVPIVDGKLAARAVVGYENLSGWIDRTNENHANDAQLRTYRLKVNAQPTDELSIGLFAWSSRDNYGAPPTADDTGHATGSVPQSVVTDYNAYGMKIGYQFSSFSVSSMTSYLHYNNDFALDLSPIQVPLPLNALVASRVFSQEITLASTGDSVWRWSAGAFYRDAQDQFSQNIGDISATDIDFTDGSKSYALFGELSRRFLDGQFEWTLGLRQFHDEVSTIKDVPTPPPSDITQSFNATTPRAVLTWFPSRDLTVYGSYSQGFRSGMPQYYSISQSAPSIPALKPDRLHNYELGAKADVFDKRVSFDAAFFYIDWRDVQQTITVPYPGNAGGSISAQVNGESASGPGFEFSVTARPLNGVDVGASLGWNDLKFDRTVYSGGLILFNKGDRLNESSEYTAAAFTNYTFPLGNFMGEVSASANYASKQSNRGLVGGAVFETNGDNLLFGRASVAIRSPRNWSATLYADNVGNEHGAMPAASPAPDWYSRPRPRTLGVQVEYHYK